MAKKRFKLKASEIRPLAAGHGGCIATDRIVVDGAPVGYMRREEPNNPDDSGWAFFAGDEPDDYVNDPANLGVYDVNTIANYDPTVVPLLRAEVGSAFIRVDGRLVRDDGE
jgi:hypothetical protein